MRVASQTKQLDVDPGTTTAFVIDVINTAAVIDGVSARVIGLPDHFVTAHPQMLPLFPDTGGQVTLSLAVPNTLPAGRHPLTVEVVSHGARLPSQFLDLDLDVAPRVGLSVAASPRVIRGRRNGRFVLELRNDGNIPLDVQLTAVDADRAVRPQFLPPSLRIEPGAVSPVLLNVQGPRMFTGGEVDRTVAVEVAARPADVIPDAEAEAQEVTICQTTVRLRQRPLISRGLLTALVLASIVLLWAGAFLLGLTKVFSGDPMTKQAPASFFLPKQNTSGGGAGETGGAGASGAALAPADSLPKTGQIAPGTGGAFSGTVIGTNNRQPVGRILVQAWRHGLKGWQPVSSAATQSDGTYTLGGLFPTSYYVQFRATGFKSVWYPGVPSRANAKPVGAQAQAVTPHIDAVITGNPASITGTVSSLDSIHHATTKVQARALNGATPTHTLTPVFTDSNGRYRVAGLAAPGTYQLTFTTPGYQTSTLVDTVSGGDARLEPAVVLGSDPGSIQGTVTDGTSPLGGATVTTSMNGKPLAVSTPTTGQVGTYVLGNLQTPGTYVLTFSAPGHGSLTKIVSLKAGTPLTTQNAVLADGTGTLTGKVVDRDGNGVGGVTVSIGGASSATPPSTTTLSAGSVKGTFAINGIPAPGTYELTFTSADYAPATVEVVLSGNRSPGTIKVILATNLGSLTGSVRERDAQTGHITDPFVGAVVTATNGQQTWTVKSSGAGGYLTHGGYLIDRLPPGTYSVTATAPGLQQQTGIVTISAGNTPEHLSLTLVKA